jgi:hypothetical protein
VFCSVGKMEAPPAPGNLLLCLSFNVHSVFKLASWYFIFLFYFFIVEISVYVLEA